MAAVTATFGAVVSEVIGADGKSYSSKARKKTIPIPGGDQTIIQRNPTSEHTLRFDVGTTATTLAAWRAKVGLFDTLVVGTYINGSALLLRVEPRRIWRNDEYITTLSFRIFRGFGSHYGSSYGS